MEKRWLSASPAESSQQTPNWLGSCSGPLVSRTVRKEIHFHWLSHPVYGILRWQPKQTNILHKRAALHSSAFPTLFILLYFTPQCLSQPHVVSIYLCIVCYSFFKWKLPESRKFVHWIQCCIQKKKNAWHIKGAQNYLLNDKWRDGDLSLIYFFFVVSLVAKLPLP